MTRQNSTLTEIGFGGGCHWRTEAVFAALAGVARVNQGFIRSHAPDDGWSEAVRIAFEPAAIPLSVLTEIHLRTHASTSNHKMRGKYRSAVYVTSEGQADEVRDILASLQSQFDAPLMTRVLPDLGFKASDDRLQRYFEKNADGPFCSRYVDPKLDLLQVDFRRHLRK